MALPGAAGAALAMDMGKKGLMPTAGPAEDAEPPADVEDGGIESIIADIDEKVPGLGALVHELVDRLRAEDEQDAAEG